MNFDAFLANSNITPDKFREDAHAQAIELTLQELALDAWARNLGLVVSDEDILEEFKQSGIDDPAELLEQWKSNGRLSEIREQILRFKAAEQARENAEVFAPGKKPAAKKPATKKKDPAKKDTAKTEPAEGKSAAKKSTAKKKTTTKKPQDEETSTK
jgi:trigger factor